MFLKKLLPHYRFDSLNAIQLDWLKEKNIHLILLDVNNTLVDDSGFNVSVAYQKWIKLCLQNDIKILLCSNNPSRKIYAFAQGLGVEAMHLSLKPLPFRVYPFLKASHIDKKHVLIAGDQIFTDILLGKFLHVSTALIKPLSDHDHLLTKLVRKIERYILKYDNSKNL